MLIIINISFAAEPKLEIDIEKCNTLNGIKVIIGDEMFYPSFAGGITVINTKGKVYYPWSEGVSFTLLNKNKSGKNISTEWIMFKKDEFYYHYGASFSVNSQNVIVNFMDLGQVKNDTIKEKYADVAAVYLDRCENASDPYIIGVPYLTTFNVLLANDCFVSLYFDWDRTNASQLIPYNSKLSNTSVYFSQYALYNPLTNGIRNKLNETIILKVSRNIDDVFPVLANPVSDYYGESSRRIVYDDWLPFNKSFEILEAFKNSGINNLWHILHNWQKDGYDISLPDVYPANINFGGNSELLKVSNFDNQNNNLFSLHENYIDIYKSSTKFEKSNLALSSNSQKIFNWYNPQNSDSSFIVKPEKVLGILSPISNVIHNSFNTTASYHDVSSSYDPSKFVDYSYESNEAGRFIQPYRYFKLIADSLRKIHNGPVSGEGLAHFLYVGYYDDISAQLHTAKSLPGSYYNQTEKLGGFYKPLFVNFDLLQMKNKSAVHGMGLYERFFYNNEYWKYMGRGVDSALMYAATEIAYGHASFFSTNSYNLLEQANLEYKFVYPLQLKYLSAEPLVIAYYEKKEGIFVSASDYIRKYPVEFDDFNSSNFMSQLYIKYNNNLEIFINRHPSSSWRVELPHRSGYYNYHAFSEKRDSLYEGPSNGGNFILPPSNGWLCYFPD